MALGGSKGASKSASEDLLLKAGGCHATTNLSAFHVELSSSLKVASLTALVTPQDLLC